MLYRALVITHVLSATIWLGGIVSFAVVIVPAGRKFPTKVRRKFLERAGRKFRIVGWGALMLLVITGTGMIVTWGITFEQILNGEIFEVPRYRMVVEKIGMVVAMGLVSFLHDFIYGPRALNITPGGAEERKERIRARVLAITTLVLTILIVIWGTHIARPGWLG